jgi:hypothetical protein
MMSEASPAGDIEHAQRYEKARQQGRITVAINDEGEISGTAFSKAKCEYCDSELAGERIDAHYTPIIKIDTTAQLLPDAQPRICSKLDALAEQDTWTIYAFIRRELIARNLWSEIDAIQNIALEEPRSIMLAQVKALAILCDNHDAQAVQH